MKTKAHILLPEISFPEFTIALNSCNFSNLQNFKWLQTGILTEFTKALDSFIPHILDKLIVYNTIKYQADYLTALQIDFQTTALFVSNYY